MTVTYKLNKVYTVGYGFQTTDQSLAHSLSLFNNKFCKSTSKYVISGTCIAYRCFCSDYCSHLFIVYTVKTSLCCLVFICTRQLQGLNSLATEYPEF